MRDREDGFTLIELLIVIIIVGILAAIAIPLFLGQREKAKDSAVKGGLHNIELGLGSWAADTKDVYPDTCSKTVLAEFVDNWPGNPWTGADMADSTVKGDYTYAPIVSGGANVGFTITGHLSDNLSFVLP